MLKTAKLAIFMTKTILVVLVIDVKLFFCCLFLHYNKLPFRKGIARVSSPKIDRLVIFFRKCNKVMSIIGDHDIYIFMYSRPS